MLFLNVHIFNYTSIIKFYCNDSLRIYKCYCTILEMDLLHRKQDPGAIGETRWDAGLDGNKSGVESKPCMSPAQSWQLKPYEWILPLESVCRRRKGVSKGQSVVGGPTGMTSVIEENLERKSPGLHYQILPAELCHWGRWFNYNGKRTAFASMHCNSATPAKLCSVASSESRKAKEDKISRRWVWNTVSKQMENVWGLCRPLEHWAGTACHRLATSKLMHKGQLGLTLQHLAVGAVPPNRIHSPKLDVQAPCTMNEAT